MVFFSYERPDSPWVWIKWGHERSNLTQEKTDVRKDDPGKARKLARILNAKEKILLASDEKGGQSPMGWGWVAPWMKVRYAGQPETFKIYEGHWSWLEKYLDVTRLNGPGVLTRADVFGYIEWRCGQVKQKSGRSPSLNSALLELKHLATILTEAITRGLAESNPASKLGIRKEDPAIKPEYTDAQIVTILEALPSRPAWMGRSWELALRTGMRFSDTRLHRRQMRWASDDILVEKPKGGRKKEFTIPIYDSIRPMLEEWWESGEPWFWTMEPQEYELRGLVWNTFFREIGLSGYCFHCTRVTFITRGMRGDPARGVRGTPEHIMCKMVNHAQKLINRIYQRWTPDDVRIWGGKLPGLPGDALPVVAPHSGARPPVQPAPVVISRNPRKTPARPPRGSTP